MEQTSVLVVDDEKNIRLTLSQSLESLPVQVQTAVNGEEALRKLREGRFDLVFLDLKMPGMDGMEVLRRVRDAWPPMRVIVITAHGSIESAVEAMKLGAADFVQKPFSPAEIRELATRVLGRDMDPASAPVRGHPEGIGSRRESGEVGAESAGGETVTGSGSVSGGTEDEE